jgi:hypothetical protein
MIDETDRIDGPSPWLIAVAVNLCIGLSAAAGQSAEPEKTPAMAAHATAPAYAPTCAYDAQEIEGWRVMINRDFPACQPELCDEALAQVRGSDSPPAGRHAGRGERSTCTCSAPSAKAMPSPSGRSTRWWMVFASTPFLVQLPILSWSVNRARY